MLGVASGYKPGILPKSSARGTTRSKAPSRGMGYGLGLLAVGIIIGCVMAIKGGGSSVPARTPATVNAAQQPARVDDVARVTEHPQAKSQPEVPAPAVPAQAPEKKSQRIARVRRLRFTLAGDGECRFLLDSRDEPSAHEEAGGEPASLTGVNNGVTKKLESGSYRLTYSFSEGGSIADFTRLGGSSPLLVQGISTDRTSGTLVMTPIKTDKLPGRAARFGFPRLVRPPLTVDVEFDRLDRGTFVVQLPSQLPSGIIVLNVAPDRGRGDLFAEVSLIPITNGKRGEAVNLLTRRFEADAVAESGFHLPGGYDASDDRFLLEFGLHGEEPVTIRRIEVSATIPATFGLSLDTDKGGVKVKSALKGGAGERAGFKAGDTLISMGGEKLTDLKGVMSRLADAPIGQEIKFIIRRAGQEKTLFVKGE